jgi:hypothetical protein
MTGDDDATTGSVVRRVGTGELTQRASVLADLQGAGGRGVCARDFYATARPNARNAISDLRAQRFHIESSPCRDHHGAAFARYRLIHGPEIECQTCPWRPRQLALAAAVA